jgi:hypothetical protein
MSGPRPELTPDERLRQLLSEAVEPVQPGPGAEARLQAKIRARRRSRDLPRRLRWAGAALGTAAVVAGGAAVIGTQTGGSSDSSASSAGSQASVPSSAGAASPASLPPASQGVRSGASAEARNASPQAGSQLLGGGAGSATAPTHPGPAYKALIPSDLDGDRVPDQLTISGNSLVVNFQHSRQTVTLPQVGAGARVLGVTLLATSAGGSTPVAIVRLEADAAHAHDTLVSLVAGKLTVLRLDGTPAVLTVAGSHGYACAGPLVISAGQVTSYVVSGADLVAIGSGGAARPGANCGFS